MALHFPSPVKAATAATWEDYTGRLAYCKCLSEIIVTHIAIDTPSVMLYSPAMSNRMCGATEKALKYVAGGMAKRAAAKKAGIAESTLHRAWKREAAKAIKSEPHVSNV